MKKAILMITRFMALSVWLAVGGAYLSSPVTAEAGTKCSDVCDGCEGANCKWCARIGDANCYDPKAAEEEIQSIQ
jgi:hypothetical protein